MSHSRCVVTIINFAYVTTFIVCTCILCNVSRFANCIIKIYDDDDVLVLHLLPLLAN